MESPLREVPIPLLKYILTLSPELFSFFSKLVLGSLPQSGQSAFVSVSHQLLLALFESSQDLVGKVVVNHSLVDHDHTEVLAADVVDFQLVWVAEPQTTVV